MTGIQIWFGSQTTILKTPSLTYIACYISYISYFSFVSSNIWVIRRYLNRAMCPKILTLCNGLSVTTLSRYPRVRGSLGSAHLGMCLKPTVPRLDPSLITGSKYKCRVKHKNKCVDWREWLQKIIFRLHLIKFAKPVIPRWKITKYHLCYLPDDWEQIGSLVKYFCFLLLFGLNRMVQTFCIRGLYAQPQRQLSQL